MIEPPFPVAGNTNAFSEMRTFASDEVTFLL